MVARASVSIPPVGFIPSYQANQWITFRSAHLTSSHLCLCPDHITSSLKDCSHPPAPAWSPSCTSCPFPLPTSHPVFSRDIESWVCEASEREKVWLLPSSGISRQPSSCFGEQGNLWASIDIWQETHTEGCCFRGQAITVWTLGKMSSRKKRPEGNWRCACSKAWLFCC